MVHLKFVLVCLSALSICGCGAIIGDSYEEDSENDWKIVREIIAENPVLSSAIDSGHYFLPTDAEYGRLTGSLDLSNLGLNDTNFRFPTSIRNFRLVKVVHLSFNDLTDLPPGTRQKKWDRVVVWHNRMCNPSSETVAYLDKLMEGFPGGYWRDSQRCSDSIPAASP